MGDQVNDNRHDRQRTPADTRGLSYLVLERLVIAQHVNAALRRFQGAARFLGLGVTASADRAPDQARWARVTPQHLSGGNAIVCDDSKRWASLTVLPISANIPIGERPEMFRVLRFLPQRAP